MDIFILIIVIANLLTLGTNITILIRVRSCKPASSIIMKVSGVELEVNPEGHITRVTF